jgi:hypothetical protein
MTIEQAKTEKIERLVNALVKIMDTEDLESYYIFHKMRELNQFNEEDLRSLEEAFNIEVK